MTMQHYRNISTIKAFGSAVEIRSHTSRWRPWSDFMPWVAVAHVEHGEDEEQPLRANGSTLEIHNATVVIHVPYSRKTTFEVLAGSTLTGELTAGNVQADESSRVKITVPFGYRRSLSPAATLTLALFEDAVYMALGFVALAAGAGAVMSLFDGDATRHIGVVAIITAGVYVGIRGSQKRALLASMAIAAACTFGPELVEAITQGPLAGFRQLGGEDVLKVLIWGATFSLGAAVRRHYATRTA